MGDPPQNDPGAHMSNATSSNGRTHPKIIQEHIFLTPHQATGDPPQMIQVLRGRLGVKVVDPAVGQHGRQHSGQQLVILDLSLDDDRGLPDLALREEAGRVVTAAQ